MREYRYFICDVFSDVRFDGNPLAVVPEAGGLSGGEMQRIAREFNFSESTFVLPGDARHDRTVRIFTPTTEVPFAGHPNIGTAFALACDGAFGEIEDSETVSFDEKAGTVNVQIRRGDSGAIWCELEAPQTPSIGKTLDPSMAAAVLSLHPDDVVTSTHPPQEASVGLPFLIVELASRDALERARINPARLDELHKDGMVADVHLYVRSNDEFDIRARMFAPLDGVPEDPATGSANCALVALLTTADATATAGGSWRIAQGVEMGRPSVLEARTVVEGDRIRTFIGGHTVLVAQGGIMLDPQTS
ncbi:MAG: PhzF family phenazine biosynthesis protein [Gammaproteobacteria bacterium]|nr:PhzF family phenazine biosynthesis protein [Gammaproteobacteria bacterium]